MVPLNTLHEVRYPMKTVAVVGTQWGDEGKGKIVDLLTERINSISEHLQSNKKDFSTHRGLMQLVGKRKRLLTYLSKQNLQGYRALIEKLGLRK